MFKKQSKINIQPTSMDYKIIRAGWLTIIFNFLMVLFVYTQLPDRIPIHFNLKGEADGFGSKINLFGLPTINLILYFTMTLVVKKIKPWQMNYPVTVTDKNAPRLYANNIRMLVLLNLGIAILFFLISLESILKGWKMDDFSIFFMIVLLLIAVTFTPIIFIIKMFKAAKK